MRGSSHIGPPNRPAPANFATMKTLAIDTTDRPGTVAALENEGIQAEKQLSSTGGTAGSLAPCLQQLLAEVGWRARQIELVAVAAGPGSFTGLRVGITAAKTLAYAAQADLIGVPSVMVIAQRVPRPIESVWVVLEAQRQQLFVAQLRRGPGALMRSNRPVEIMSFRPWCDLLRPGDWLTGPGLVPWQEHLPRHARIVDASLWRPTAAAVGLVAGKLHQQGQRDDPWKLTPLYVRQSAAEEKESRARKGERGA